MSHVLSGSRIRCSECPDTRSGHGSLENVMSVGWGSLQKKIAKNGVSFVFYVHARSGNAPNHRPRKRSDDPRMTDKNAFLSSASDTN